MCETLLWRAVILQVLLDAKNEATKREFRQAKKEAIYWIDNRGRDFTLICELADMQPEKTEHLILKAKSNKFQWREPDGKGWRRQGLKNHFRRERIAK